MAMKILSFTIPIRTVSEANSSEHWVKKHKRHWQQKLLIKSAFIKEKIDVSLPCKITVVRIAPRALDKHDNLRTSLKYIVDAISENITGIKKAGRADDIEGFEWEYDQRKGKAKEYAVEITIEEK